jgi:predicted RNA binding protein YcfA (HicA-like mRNA interferase family)
MPMTIKEAEKLLKEAGYKEVKGGKGSHRKYVKEGALRPFILPSHGKELSRIVEKSIKETLDVK